MLTNKKIILIITSFFIIFIILFIFLFLSSKNNENNEIVIPTGTSFPTEIIVKQKPTFVPTPTPTKLSEKAPLSVIKNKLIDGYKFEDIILDYRQGPDLIIVFYPTSKSLAQEQAKKFFEKEGITNLSGINIEYIGLKKDSEEPPAGFFR